MARGCVQACDPWHLGRPRRQSSRQPLRDFNPFAARSSGRRSGALCGWGCAFPGPALSEEREMTAQQPKVNLENMPAPAEGILVTHFLIVRDVARSRAFYADVLGG